jgi:hypothetical protein
MSGRFRVSAVVLLLVLVVGSCFGVFSVFGADDVSSKVSAAEGAVASAFSGVLDAEKAGANVTGLLVQLDNSAGLLAQAEMAFRKGDANATAVKADGALAGASVVQSEASAAKDNALVASQNALWLTVGFSLVGSVAFVLVLFFVWRWLRRRYSAGLLEAKPEVDLR